MRRTWFLVCLILLLASPLVSFGEIEAERKERLEKQLRELDQQILQQQQKVEAKQAERQTIERDLDLIEAEVSKAQLGIRARALAIEQLLGQIDEKGEVIEILSERSIRQKQSLAELIRKTEEIDNFSLV